MIKDARQDAVMAGPKKNSRDRRELSNQKRVVISFCEKSTKNIFKQQKLSGKTKLPKNCHEPLMMFVILIFLGVEAQTHCRTISRESARRESRASALIRVGMPEHLFTISPQ